MNYHASISRYPFVSLLVFGSTGRPRPKLWNDSFLTAQPWILCTWWAIVVGRFAHDRNQGCCGTRRKTVGAGQGWTMNLVTRATTFDTSLTKNASCSIFAREIISIFIQNFFYRKIHILCVSYRFIVAVARHKRHDYVGKIWNRSKNECKTTSLYWSLISIRLEDLPMCHIFFIGMPL